MTPEGEGINVADVPFPPGPHGFLCDLGRVASEPPVPGHDHGEDVDVWECQLRRLLRQPGELRERRALSQMDRAAALLLMWVCLRPVPLVLSPEKSIIVGWGVPHPQRWR